ncbi:hypothetical protein GQ607_015890 [Colletotrichum asianum]|uniref:Uncharacterized protein n=1 Tax=Colletotrichum asianum TaxID=702518 RepID=A0A8H3W237_9PEZI|nr:hypothetical protein GQ607_015890 [Colletotrichum asianum]
MPSGPSIDVTLAKDAEIVKFLDSLCAGFSNAALLRAIFGKEPAAAKKKHAGVLVNAQKTMNPLDTIELALEIGPEACSNNQVMAELKAAAPAKDSAVVKRTLQRKSRAGGTDGLYRFLDESIDYSLMLLPGSRGAEVDGNIRLMMRSLLESVFRPAESILASGQSGAVLTYLESRKH